jgi:tryptophan synthase alpha chain
MHALVTSGADLIELGVPFSDPMADGPVIQAASERALGHQIGLVEVLESVKTFRQRDRETPVVLMGYLNPIVVRGVEWFAREAALAGVDGMLIVDVPPEEVAAVREPLQQHGLQQIFLVAPTTDDERMATICGLAEGFIYYVALKGVTGASLQQADQIGAAVDRIRNHSQLPVGVGFGIKSAQDAAAVGERADAVVIGSALVSSIDKARSREQAVELACEFLTPIRDALDQLS